MADDLVARLVLVRDFLFCRCAIGTRIFVVVILSTSTQMLETYLKLGHYHFFPRDFLFRSQKTVICSTPTVESCKNYTTHRYGCQLRRYELIYNL